MARRSEEAVNRHPSASDPEVFARIPERCRAYLLVWWTKETSACSAQDRRVATTEPSRDTNANAYEWAAKSTHLFDLDHGDASQGG
jgi:hypothetical protein